MTGTRGAVFIALMSGAWPELGSLLAVTRPAWSSIRPQITAPATAALVLPIR